MSLRPRQVWLRRRIRSSELALIAVAILVGAAAGLLSVVQGAAARTLQHLLFNLPADERLSGAVRLHWTVLVTLPVGGAILAGFSLLTRARKRALVDTVEANALHGGQMSWTDSLIVSAQTIISNGFGASVGLEAAYAQLGGAVASVTGQWLTLRRSDLRTLVGAGTGAAIGAAFGAPLAGAFYAFEIVLGAYTPATIAPVAAAALAGVLVAQILGAQPYLIDATAGLPVETHHYLIYGGLGAIAAGIGIVLMRTVGKVERAARRLPVRPALLPAIGGLLLIPLAFLTPQVLSAGHGALHLDLEWGVPLGFLAAVFIVKCAASAISLGFGFRGGLFFASLFLGSLLGHLFAGGLNTIAGFAIVDPRNAALVGMAALAVAVVGGPFTMAMLVLEATHDFSLTGAVIAAALVSSAVAREGFGYSFSTWRLHLRGETIRSARDIGWARSLTAGRLMRPVTTPLPDFTSIRSFREQVPLGSTSRNVLVDEDGRYSGILQTAAAYVESAGSDGPVRLLAVNKDVALGPGDSIHEIMATFDAVAADELAVVGADGAVLGILSEAYTRRRYAEELEKSQRELFRET